MSDTQHTEQIRAIGLSKFSKELLETVKRLEKEFPVETRGDIIRRFRAALELVPAYSDRGSKYYDQIFS